MLVSRMPLKVGLTYNLKKEFSRQIHQPIDAYEEFDAEETIDAIEHVLEEDGYEVIRLGGDVRLLDRLRETSIDMVFNIAEGLGGRNREAHIPALLEFRNPYTGSDPLTLAHPDKSIREGDERMIPTPKFKKGNTEDLISELVIPLLNSVTKAQ
jgi:D-alanine-D-alanine ligase